MHTIAADIISSIDNFYVCFMLNHVISVGHFDNKYLVLVDYKAYSYFYHSKPSGI